MPRSLASIPPRVGPRGAEHARQDDLLGGDHHRGGRGGGNRESRRGQRPRDQDGGRGGAEAGHRLSSGQHAATRVLVVEGWTAWRPPRTARPPDQGRTAGKSAPTDNAASSGRLSGGRNEPGGAAAGVGRFGPLLPVRSHTLESTGRPHASLLWKASRARRCGSGPARSAGPGGQHARPARQRGRRRAGDPGGRVWARIQRFGGGGHVARGGRGRGPREWRDGRAQQRRRGVAHRPRRPRRVHPGTALLQPRPGGRRRSPDRQRPGPAAGGTSPARGGRPVRHRPVRHCGVAHTRDNLDHRYVSPPRRAVRGPARHPPVGPVEHPRGAGAQVPARRQTRARRHPGHRGGRDAPRHRAELQQEALAQLHQGHRQGRGGPHGRRAVRGQLLRRPERPRRQRPRHPRRGHHRRGGGQVRSSRGSRPA